ncbi:MAG: hypothetical protein JNK65_03960 [Deltaproteobacteria bacterium]|nr:hypothetical protein [Deltaproteobacteria bacterium]
MKPILKILFLSFLATACSAESQPKSIRGKISMSSNLSSKVGASDVVLVMVYPQNPIPESSPKPESTSSIESQTILPIAVKKIAPAVFPIAYSITEDDVVFPEKRFVEKMFIAARVDKDGNTNTLESGVMEGVYKKNPVNVGSKNIDFTIDKLKP